MNRSKNALTLIKSFIRKIVLREKASSDGFVAYLKKRGVQIGNECYIPEPSSVLIDLTEPWLIVMGDNITLTHGVSILTHDYGWSVLKKYGDSKGAVLGSQAPVRIGNNVFIGVNTVITKGVTIGDNVIIGAGSVVHKDCDSDSVYAGNPAEKIMTIGEYAARREQKQFEEAKRLAIAYRERFLCEPPMEIFKEYFMLFCTADEAMEIPMFCSQMHTCGNYDDAVSYMISHKPMFDSYEDFLKECYSN